MYREMLAEIVKYRGLLGMLAWRDIRVRYKQSVMGFAWAFLMPLIQAVVLWAIFTYGMRGMTEGMIANMSRDMPYFLFVLSGMIPWTFVASSINFSVESLTRNSRLVTKIYFPREVFPLGSVTASLVDFGVAMLVFVPFYVYHAATGHVQVGWALLFFPVIVLIQVLFVSGLALILSMANLFFRDVKYVTTFVLQLWFFATNVMYPIRFENYPSLQWIPSANPMIPILDAYRDVIAGHWLSNPVGLMTSTAIALAVFLLGWRAFHKAEFKFAEYV
jgi:ABC-type polysaccharide/polyol phosphate export permease